VIRNSEYEASDVVPGPGSNVRHPLAVFPSLHRVPAGLVPRLQQYYEGATTSFRPSHRTSLPSFGGTSVALVSSLLDRRVHRRSLELVTRFSSREFPRRRKDLPSSWKVSIVRLHMFQSDSGRTLTPDHYGAVAWPLVCEKQRLPRKVFRSSIAWLSDSLSTLRRVRYLTRR
jgi:hypothetical protein